MHRVTADEGALDAELGAKQVWCHEFRLSLKRLEEAFLQDMIPALGPRQPTDTFSMQRLVQAYEKNETWCHTVIALIGGRNPNPYPNTTLFKLQYGVTILELQSKSGDDFGFFALRQFIARGRLSSTRRPRGHPSWPSWLPCPRADAAFAH